MLGARLPSLLASAERVAATVAQGVHGRRRAGMGDSFWQYRQALPGEPISRIDWRQSARSSRAFVRETEWEAAQSVYLWQDLSPSMDWRSQASLPLKSTRAELLLLALACLLLRGGEHVGLLPEPGERAGAGLVFGQSGLQRLARKMAASIATSGATSGAASGATSGAASGANSASLPPLFDLPRHAHLVLIGDLLAPPEQTAVLFERLHAFPAGCTVLQILDPAELSLSYSGRVRFEGLEGEAAITTQHAQDLGTAYAEAFAAHQDVLARSCSRAGFGLVRHRTDEAPQAALLELHGWLSRGARRA